MISCRIRVTAGGMGEVIQRSARPAAKPFARAHETLRVTDPVKPVRFCSLRNFVAQMPKGPEAPQKRIPDHTNGKNRPRTSTQSAMSSPNWSLHVPFSRLFLGLIARSLSSRSRSDQKHQFADYRSTVVSSSTSSFTCSPPSNPIAGVLATTSVENDHPSISRRSC